VNLITKMILWLQIELLDLQIWSVGRAIKMTGFQMQDSRLMPYFARQIALSERKEQMMRRHSLPT
jgi:hypothetical protein